MKDAQELSERMIAILKELDGAYRIEEAANEALSIAVEAYDLKKAKTFLSHKATNGDLTGKELDARSVEAAHLDRMEAVKSETQAKRAQHNCRLLDKELSALMTMLAVEKVKIEKGIEIQ